MKAGLMKAGLPVSDQARHVTGTTMVVDAGERQRGTHEDDDAH